MRRKRKDSIRYVDGEDEEDFDNFYGIHVDQSENDNLAGRQNCHQLDPEGSQCLTENGREFQQLPENIDPDCLSQAKVVDSVPSADNISKSLGSHENKEEVSDINYDEDHAAENKKIKIETPDAEISNSGIRNNSSEDDLSWVMDNPWYSVKARRGEDGLKEFIFICRICGRQCQRRANMEDHVRSHAGIKPFHCQLCTGKFSRKQNLKSHLAKMHKLNEAKVKSLLQGVDSPGPAVNCRELRQYLKSAEVSDKSFNQVCGEKSNTHPEELSEGTKGNRHFSLTSEGNTDFKMDARGSSDSEDSQNRVENDEIKYGLGKQDGVVLKTTITDDRLTCPKKGFKLVEDYGEFICMTPKEGNPTKVYQCKTCNYECVRRYTMRTHTWIHTGVKKYFCEICDNAFTRNTYLKVHLTRAHSITGAELDDIIRRASETASPGILTSTWKTEKRQIDYKLFKNHQYESNSIGIVKNEMPGCRDDSINDRCETVSRSIKSGSEALNEKKLTIPKNNSELIEKVQDYGNFVCVELLDGVSESKVYRCKVCSYECTRRYTMKTHVWTHTGYKRYCCSLCGHSFTRSTYFRFHLRKAHSLSGAELDNMVKTASEVIGIDSHHSQGESFMSSDDDQSKNLSDESYNSLLSNSNFYEYQKNEADEKKTLTIQQDIDADQNESNYSSAASELGTTSDTTVEFDVDSFIHTKVNTCNAELSHTTSDRSVNFSTEKTSEESSADKELTDADSVKDVIKMLMDVETLQCLKCLQICSSKANLKAHVKTHFNIKPYTCPICFKRFGKRGNMKEHARIMHRLVGPFTGTGTLPKSHPGNSYTMVQSKEEIRDAKSKECTPETMSKESTPDIDMPQVKTKKSDHGVLTDHLRGDKDNVLESSISKFMDIENLRCLKCQKICSTKGNLKAHVRLHLNLRPFTCPHCPKTFNKSSNMRFHARKKHSMCSSSFEQSADLFGDSLDSQKSENLQKQTVECNINFKMEGMSEMSALEKDREGNFKNVSKNDEISEDDSSSKDCSSDMAEKEEKAITSINFETMAEELWGYNKHSREENNKVSKQTKCEQKGSEEEKVEQPYHFMTRDNFEKTDYQNLMSIASHGNLSHWLNKSGYESLNKKQSNTVEVAEKFKVTDMEIKLEREADSNKCRLDSIANSPLADPYFVKLKLLMDEQNLQCRDCYKKFANKWSLKAHVKAIHLQGKQFVCSVCSKTFNFKCNLERHYTVHNPNWVKEKAPFEPLQQQQDTKNESAREREFSGSEKDKSSSNENSSDIGSPGKPSASMLSPKRFLENSESPIRHSAELESPGKVSTDDEISNLEVESLMDLDFFQCKKCLKQFANKWSLKAHVKSIHVQSRKYVCPVCQKSFNHKCNLDRHFTVHPEYVPKKEIETAEVSEFQCSFCKKSFANKWSMKAHIKSIHIHSRQYACPVCEKSFNHKCNLDRHIVLHVGPRFNNFIDETKSESDSVPLDLSRDSVEKDRDSINETYRDSEDSVISPGESVTLSYNERILMDVDKLKCVRCGKQCSSKANLKTHVRLHLDLNHVCDVCQKSFSSKDYLKRHYKVHFPRGEFFSDYTSVSAFDGILNKTSRDKKCIPDEDDVTADIKDRRKTVEELPSIDSDEDGPVFCGLCGEKFDSRNALHEHFEMHEGI